MRVIRLAVMTLGLAAALSACALDKQNAPELAGPSELGLAVTVTATPDVLTQDGASQSVVGILARDASGQPARGVTFRVETLVGSAQTDFGTLSSRVVSTNDNGRAQVTYTAPPAPPPSVTSDTTVTVSFAPVGTDYSSTVARTVALHLLRPGVIAPPSSGITASFTVNPTSAKMNEPVLFDASASVATGRTIQSYSWSFGDGRSGTGRTVQHTYQSAGSFVATLTVTDDLGRTADASAIVSVSIVAPTPPTAVIIASPSDPQPGQTVYFSGEASTPAVGRSIVSYEWNFGDGTTGSGPTVSHQYGTEEHSYLVTLRVTDDLGQQNVATATVDVRIPVPPTPPAP